MVDFHTHILPIVDDGAHTVEETFNMIQEAKEAGFNSILLTSHYIEDSYTANESERNKLINKLKEVLKENNVNINLYLGNEIYISDNIIQLLENKMASTINGTNYVLFELPFNSKPLNLYNVIYELLGCKYIPILAHPERYSYIWQEPNIICELIQKGVLMQSNYGSFIGLYGKRSELIAKLLLKNDMIHFLGTDVHTTDSIYPKIPKILNEIEKLIGKEKLDIISKINPNLILSNKKIELEDPQEIKLSFKEKLLLKKK